MMNKSAALPKQSEISNLVNKISESKYGKRVFKKFKVRKENVTNRMKIAIPRAMAQMNMQMKIIQKIILARRKK